MHFRKLPPKIINYKDFKKFKHLQYTLSEEHVDNNKNPGKFYEICHSVLDNLTPRKNKNICGSKAFHD